MEVNFNIKTFSNISQTGLKEILSNEFYTNIVIIKKGSLTYMSGKEECSLKENQVAVIPPYANIKIKGTQKRDLSASVFSYFLNSDIMHLLHLPVPVILDSSSPISLELNDYFSLKENTGYKEILLKKSLEYKIIYLAESFENTENIAVNPRMQPLMSFIQKNLSLNFTVKEMAKECNLSEALVYKMFEDFLKISPKQFIRNQRMKYALHLLLNTKMSISEISYESGFYDQYYFSKEFKKTFSLSPSHYRKNTEK